MAFRTILAEESRQLLRGRAWQAVLGLLTVLTVVAALNGAARFEQLTDASTRLNDDEAALVQGMKSTAARHEASPSQEPPAVVRPGNVGLSVLGHYAVLRFGPLAGISVGQSDVQPSHYRVTAHPRHSFLNAAEVQNPLIQVIGSFDLAFVWVFILPILVIATSFDLVSREREIGTLGLVVAQGVRLRTLILAKVAARLAMLLPLLLILVILVGLVLGADPREAAVAWRLLAMFALGAGYVTFWLVLALAVNAFNWRSETNGVVLANLWLVFVVVVPSIVNVLAATLYPAPSRVSLTTEMREAAEIADREAAAARDAYFFDHPDLAGAAGVRDEFYLRVLATDAAVEKAVAPILVEFDRQASLREDVVGRLRYASPAIATQDALNALAGTDDQAFADFVSQVTAFHERWRGFFVERILRGQLLTAADFDRLPAFDYAPPPLARALSDTRGPLVYLLGVALALAGWAARRYRRYPIV